MEKLIELLNEYAHTYADHYDDTGEEIEIKFLEHTDNCFIYYCDGKFDGLVDDTVISKRFGFISWLVENSKVQGFMLKFYIKKLGTKNVYIQTPLEDNILMYLSISSNPINDLIGMLK